MSRRSGAWRRGAILVIAVALTGTACSSDGSGPDAAPTTTEAAVQQAICAMGASQDEVVAVPVEGTASDRSISSFDGTVIRAHWFPVGGATAQAPAATVLMGPGWSQPGDVNVEPREGPGLFSAVTIPALHEAGYNVLTWDPRGFGESEGAAAADAPDTEGRDTQVLLDFVAAQPEALLDADGDPRVGMVGFSYGGGIQLTLAGIDCRVDAIVPGLAWNSMETSLFLNETSKLGWGGLLARVGAAAGELDPHIASAAAASETGEIDEADLEWFRSRGPDTVLAGVRAPTLLVQGTVDTLFTLDEAITIWRVLTDQGVETSMLWFCGGHGVCLTEHGDQSRVTTATLAWLARYLDGDETVDTGPTFDILDQDGVRWTASQYPAEPDEVVQASGSGTLTLQADGGAGPVEIPAGVTDLLAGLVAPITPGVATNAVEVEIDPGEVDGVTVAPPMLALTYSGTAPDGPEPVRVFAQIVDDERGVVVGNQITPIPLRLDGESHSLEVDLETVAQHVEPGKTLTLQIVATTVAYAVPRLGGEVTFEAIDLRLPVQTDLERAG